MRDGAASNRGAASVTRSPTRRREKSWSKHWPLPVSLGLAIVYWLYLNEQISRTEKRQLPIHLVKVGQDLVSNRLNLRTPGDGYMITELRDASDKLFGLDKEVTFEITAPGAHLKKIHTELTLIADVDLPENPRLLDQRVFRWTLSKAKVKDASGELTPFIETMKPAELTVVVKSSGSLNLALHPDHVRMKPEGGEWSGRIFRESLKFHPEYVTLSGPKAELDKITNETEIFIMDLTEALKGLVSARPDHRQSIYVKLRLRDTFMKQGIRIAGEKLDASVQVAPEPALFKDLTVQVLPDWANSSLDAHDFKIDGSVKVEIRSYNRELTRRLQDPEASRKWIAEHVRCHVRVAEIESALDPNKADFVAHLEPHWFIYGDFRLDRDLKIQQRELIQIERKTP